MSTQREKQLQQFYEHMVQLEELVATLNDEARHLGNEMTFTTLRLYKEQNDQLDDIKAYFDEVNMDPEKNTTEEILTVALKQFHEFITSLKSDR
ncbi:hypothetical protein [Desertibacillus haloalkaliphilus]|uniref:hypothetical protein n=1 Tax=Desertibacillus haloalkaliphilus TaxID=1328930 RepID=UPI001C272375|nr:hypothetical protein [Desertibacillus haloalkaliphilus]MBU8906929.1 hypothetical protein [Desertibacillus haloalkaliphilus]